MNKLIESFYFLWRYLRWNNTFDTLQTLKLFSKLQLLLFDNHSIPQCDFSVIWLNHAALISLLYSTYCCIRVYREWWEAKFEQNPHTWRCGKTDRATPASFLWRARECVFRWVCFNVCVWRKPCLCWTEGC